MRLRRLRLRDFRHVVDREVEFAEGVTIVEGPNEVGKSSLADALRLLLDPKIKHGSTAETVKRECPKGREAWPDIEAEIECGSHCFIYRKRFARGAAGGTELTILAPKRDSLVGDEAMRCVERILGEEVDLELFQALQVAQGDGVRPLAIAGSGWLAEALDAAAGGNGAGSSERDEPLFERARQEFELYFTAKGHEKKGSEPTELRAAELAARERRDQAATALEDARATVAEFERIDEEVRELERRLPHLVEERDACERAWTDLTAQVEELERLAPELEQKQEWIERLVAATDARAASQRRIEEATRELETRQVTRGALVAEHERARDEAARTEEELRKAAAAHEVAVAARELRERDEEDARHDARAATLLKRRAELAELLEELEPLEVLATRNIDAPTADAVTSADARLQAAREAATRAATTVEIEALSDVAVELDGRTAELEAGERRAREVTGALEIRLPDQLVVRIRPGASDDERRNAVERAERDLDKALRAVGAGSVEEARELWNRVRDARAKLEPRRRRIEELTADVPESERGPLAALDAELERLRDGASRSNASRPPEPARPADPVAAVRLLDEATRRERETRRELDARRELRDDSAQKAVGAAGRLALADQDLLNLEQRLRTDRESLDAERDRESDDALHERLSRARDDLRIAAERARALRAALDAADVEGKRHAAENARRVVQDRERALGERREQRIRLHDRVQQLGGQGLFEAADQAGREHEEVAAELERVAARAGAARRLFATLSESRDQARARYRDPLRERIEVLARPVFGESVGIELGDELTIASRSVGGTALAFEQLSVGAREQLDLIHRIAVAQLVAARGGVPLILDDTLGNADPERLRAMNLLLARAGEHVQVIVLTCHPDRFDRVGGAHTVRLTES